MSRLHTEAVLFSKEGADLEAASAQLAAVSDRDSRQAAYAELRLSLKEATDKLEGAGVPLAPGFEDFAELCSIRQARAGTAGRGGMTYARLTIM